MKHLTTIIIILILKVDVFCQSTTISPDGVFIPRVNNLGTCASPSKGQMAYLNSDNKIYFCNGSTWLGTSSDFSLPFTGLGTSSSGLLNISNNASFSNGWAIQSQITSGFNTGNALISYTAGTGSAAYLYTSNGNGHALKTYGDLNFSGIDEAAGKVLTSDGSGNAKWKYPDQVAFSVTSNNTYAGITEGEYLIIDYTDKQYDLSSNISLGTNKFIAPWKGIYHFDASIKANPNGYLVNDGWYSLSLWKNNVKNTETVSQIDLTVSANLSRDILLEANDVVEMRFKFDDINILDLFGRVYGQSHNNYFTGHLVTRID